MEVKEYCTQENRINEESYAINLTGIKRLDVEFRYEGKSHIEKNAICINPGVNNVYKNSELLRKVEDKLKLDHVFSTDEYNALKLISRIENVKCCLRLMYAQLPEPYKDEHQYNKLELEIIKFIYDIVENSYIDIVSKVYKPKLMGYRNFDKCISLYLGEESEDYWVENLTYSFLYDNLLFNYLIYVRKMMLYPQMSSEPYENIREYVDKTKPLFAQGSVCSKKEIRFSYVISIFEVIRHLLPEVADEPQKAKSGFKRIKLTKDEDTTEIDDNLIKFKTLKNTEDDVADSSMLHDKDPDDWDDIQPDMEKDAPVKNAGGFDDSDESSEESDDENDKPQIIEYKRVPECKYNLRHQSIRVEVVKYKPYESERNEYNEIRKKYAGLISNYRNKIDELLAVPQEQTEIKQFIGSELDSKRLCDIKGRYWIKKNTEIIRPELSVLFMVDNSGSMHGERIELVREAMVIIHEVLKKKDIEYAIVGYTALIDRMKVVHNLAIDFKSREKEKYNLMTMCAGEDNRDGASLIWAEEFLTRNANTDNKIIICISDGLPFHIIEGVDKYTPPQSSEDTKRIVRNIERNGTKVIAVAIEEGGRPCYDSLTGIYSEVIECNQLNRLPKQLFELISKQIKEAM